MNIPSNLVAHLRAWLVSDEGKRYACTRDYLKPFYPKCEGCLIVAAIKELEARPVETTARREYHANGTYWSGVPTVDLPCDFCGQGIVAHDPRTHACPAVKATGDA